MCIGLANQLLDSTSVKELRVCLRRLIVFSERMAILYGMNVENPSEEASQTARLPVQERIAYYSGGDNTVPAYRGLPIRVSCLYSPRLTDTDERKSSPASAAGNVLFANKTKKRNLSYVAYVPRSLANSPLTGRASLTKLQCSKDGLDNQIDMSLICSVVAQQHVRRNVGVVMFACKPADLYIDWKEGGHKQACSRIGMA